MSSGLEIAAFEIDLLAMLIIGAGVGVFVAKVGRFPYTIALLLAGIAVSILQISFEIPLTHDVIFLIFLPPLLFEGAATLDFESLRSNLLPVVSMAVVGLVLSVLVLGVVGTYALGLPLAFSLLFAAMILPTDPVSVLALFKEVGAPERLSVLVEGESLINDGVGVVIFTTVLALAKESQKTGKSLQELVSPERLAETVIEIGFSSLGGLVIGLAAGYLVYTVMINLDEHMTEIVLTVILAYGSFLLAEHYVGVSGVIATVAAGLLIGNRGAEYAMSPQTKISIFNTWETAAFLVNTFIFLLIGARTPVNDLIGNADLIAIAIVLVLLARAIAVYPLTAIANQFTHNPVPFNYQHVMLWGGIHASIPIALVLGLSKDLAYFEELQAMVFGVASFSLIVQGLTMGKALDFFDIITKSDEEELYELLLGRARAVDSALESVDRLHERGNLPTTVHEEFKAEYGREKDELNRAIAQLLSENPEIRQEELLVGERLVLKQEKSAIMDAMRQGVITDDVGEELLEEINIKIDRVNSGDSTVRDQEKEEAYDEFWRKRANEYGLDFEE